MARTYKIFHPIGQMNHFCDENICAMMVAEVEAENIQQAFVKSQNDFNPEYAKLGIRSTSVGDVIVCCFVSYMVQGVGFKRLDHYKGITISPIDQELTDEEYEQSFNHICEQRDWEITNSVMESDWS